MSHTLVEEDSGVTVHRMQPPGVEFPVFEPPAYWLGYTWSVLRELRILLRETSFDVIDFPDYGAEGFAFQTDRTPWSWVPVVVQLHGPLAMFTKRIGWPDVNSNFYRIAKFMEKTSIQLADSLMSCSANIADFTADFYHVPRGGIDVVHCGVDAENFSPDETFGSRRDEPTVLFVGNIAENKGVDTVVMAIARLRAKYPDIRLQIIGKADDDYAEQLRLLAGRAGAARNLEFVGFIGDRARLPDFYRGAHVFASPAPHEVGVANVYLEAMACGCPVVASTTGAAREAITDGESGILVPPGDVAATGHALDKILSDPSLREHMGRAARQRVDDYFAMDKYIRRVLTVYEQAIHRSQERSDFL